MTGYIYDGAGQLAEVVYSDGTPSVSYVHDRIGRQLSANTPVSTNQFSYSLSTLDLVSETQNNVIMTLTNDFQGRISSFNLGEDYGIKYCYDDYGRLRYVVAQDGMFFSTNDYWYVPGADLLAGSSAGPLTVCKNYESDRDLIVSISNMVNQANSSLVSSFTYKNDALGRRVSRNAVGVEFDQSQTWNWACNLRSEITSVGDGKDVYAYNYDSIGNRISDSRNSETNLFIANALNQYTGIMSRSGDSQPIYCVYDLDGNMITNGVWSYMWDGENRLVSALSNDLLVASFKYDYLSRRISKNSPAKTHTFLYNNWAMIREEMSASSDDAIVRNYYYGLDIGGSINDAGTVGGLWLSRSNMHSWFYTFDASGNISGLVDDEGLIVGHYEYDPFGTVVSRMGVGAEANPFRFSTKYSDDELGLYYYGFRYYLPTYGRWLGIDPLEEKGGLNLYQFVMNNPYDKFDALGLWNPFYIDLPATPGKCSYVAYLISFWANIDAHNACLWYQYITGGGMLLTLDYSWFDPSGILRLNARNRVEERAKSAAGFGSGLACDESAALPSEKFSNWGLSPVVMIFQWSQTTEYTLTVTKTCDECKKCKSIGVSGNWNNTANDVINWNKGNGSQGWTYPPAYITDRLVDACSFGTDYPINATDSDSGEWTFDCQ